MFLRTRKFALHATTVLAMAVVAVDAEAHTISIGYANAGAAGSVNFWYGTYHTTTDLGATLNYTEGSLHVTNTSGYNQTIQFTQLVNVKPTGLIDGTNNFYINSPQRNALTATPYPSAVHFWQGATLTNLSAGTYTFTYVPIQNPTDVWQPIANAILSNTVTISAADVGSSNWTSVGNTAGGHATPLGPTLDLIANNGGLSSQLSSLSGLSSGAQYHGMKQLSATTLTASTLTTGQTFTPSNVAIDTHLQTIVSDASLGKSAAAGDAYQQGAFWGEFLGNSTSLGNSSSGDGFASTSAGLMAGADVFVDEDAVVGLAYNWLRSSARGKGDSSSNSTLTNTYQVNLYGSLRPDGDPLWLQGVTSLGLNDYAQKRGIDYLGEVASASYTGLQMQAKATVGYDFQVEDMEGLTLAPVSSLEFARVQNHAYTETGSSVDQWVKGHGFNSVDSVLGGKATQKFDVEDIGPVTADVQAGWLHDYIRTPISTTAVLQGVSYAEQTSRLPSNGAQVAVGANVQQSDDLSVRVEYQGDIRPGYTSHTAALKIRQSF